MKFSAAKAAGFIARPDPGCKAALLYGPDATLVSAERARLMQTLLAGDDDPFRTATLSADTVRKDPASLLDECNAMSFGGGDRVVILPDASDSVFKAVESALDGMAGGSFLIVAAGSLPPSSKLRKLFENAPDAAALPFYPAEGAAIGAKLAEMLKALKAPALTRDAEREAAHLLEGADHGEVARFAEVLALYALEAPDITPKMLSEIAPVRGEAAYDALANAAAGGDAAATPELVRKLAAQGQSLQGALRVLALHFLRLHLAQAQVEAGQSLDSAVGRLRPPVFFKARPAFLQQCRVWRTPMLERALGMISETEALLRSGRTQPDEALVERLTMRLALMARQG